MKRRSLSPLILLLPLLAACTATNSLSLVTSKRTPIDRSKAQNLGSVSAEVLSHTIVIIPTRLEEIYVQDAVAEALAKSGGDFLTDVTATRKYFWLPFIYGRFGWEVTGTAWRSRPSSTNR